METYSVAPAPFDEKMRIFFPNENSIGNRPTYDLDGRLATYSAILFLLLLTLLGAMAALAVFVGRRTSTTHANGANNNFYNNAEGGFNREAAHGLDKTVIESFPVFSYSLVKGLKAEVKASDCVVCLCDFEDEEMLRLLPECHHAFHPECIDMWLCSHTTCPVCRTSLVPEGTQVQTQAPPEQVTIAIDDDRWLSNGEGSPETGRDSVASSLIRLRKEMEQATEWYIATPEGLTPGTHRSCSFVGRHLRLMAATSRSHKPGGSVGSAVCGTTSETLGSISENPGFVLRTFSERISPQCREETGAENALRKKPSCANKAISVDFQEIFKKRTFSWLSGGDQDMAEFSQSGAAATNA